MRLVIVRMRWVRFTFLPSSFRKMVTIVSLPSLFFVRVGWGRAVARSGSSSSAQSVRPGALDMVGGLFVCVVLFPAWS